MRIGIDARPLMGRRTGIGKFLEGLLNAVAREDRGHEFILYAPSKFTYDPPNSRWRASVHRGFKGTNGVLWLQLPGRSIALRDGVDVFWGPLFHLPLLLPAQIPALVTVHDLVHLFFPHTMEIQNYILMKLFLKPSLRRAQHVTADSKATAADLHRWLRVPKEKITVIYPGVTSDFHVRDPVEIKKRMADVFGLSGPYLLTVATLEPRKNLVTLLRAFASLPRSLRENWPLVVVGRTGWKTSSIFAAAAPLVSEGAVRLLGYVPDVELPWLYAGATVFLFPSVYEGFGIPMAEAMASGIPVVASDIPVAREVAADAAFFVKPLDVDGWAQAIVEIIHDERRRNMLREAGRRRAGEFTFEESARRLLAVIERIGRNRDSEMTHVLTHSPTSNKYSGRPSPG